MPIRIRSKQQNFIRCGVRHPDTWVEHPDGKFSREQIAALKAEPMLQVEIVPGKSEKTKDEK